MHPINLILVYIIINMRKVVNTILGLRLVQTNL